VQVLARLWRREVEPAIAPPPTMPRSTSRSTPPSTPPKPSVVEVRLESPAVPGPASPPTSRRRKRKKSGVPVERIWLRDRETPPPLRPKEELSQYKTSKGALQFPIDTPLPKALVRRLIAIRKRQAFRPNR
jgi:hypothetical protein